MSGGRSKESGNATPEELVQGAIEIAKDLSRNHVDKMAVYQKMRAWQRAEAACKEVLYRVAVNVSFYHAYKYPAVIAAEAEATRLINEYLEAKQALPYADGFTPGLVVVWPNAVTDGSREDLRCAR